MNSSVVVTISDARGADAPAEQARDQKAEERQEDDCWDTSRSALHQS